MRPLANDRRLSRYWQRSLGRKHGLHGSLVLGSGEIQAGGFLAAGLRFTDDEELFLARILGELRGLQKGNCIPPRQRRS